MIKREAEKSSGLRPARTILVLLLLAAVLLTAWCLSPVPALLAQQTAMRHMEKFTSGQVGGAEITSEQWREFGPIMSYRTGFGIECRTNEGVYALEIIGGYLPFKVVGAVQTQKTIA